jgi:hypothetical protein
MNERGPWLSIAVCLGLIALGADQIAAALAERAVIAAAATEQSAQAKPLEAAQRIETQLDALASGTSRLAQSGNPNAARIVAAMQANGISLHAKQ